jgi:hypothetical protein
MLHVVNWTGGGSKLKNVIHRTNVIWTADVELNEFKARLSAQVGNVAQATGKKIVNTNNVVVIGKEGIAKM